MSLSGSGATGALLLVSPNALLFGDQPAGTISLSQTITLTSSGSAAVTLPAGAIRVSADFIISHNACGLSLSPGASCSVAVQYQPSQFSSDFEAGSVNITDNAPGNPQTVSLTCNTGVPGNNPATATLVSSASPVAAGQPVTFTAKVSPVSPVTTIPNGTVLFLDGTITIGAVQLDATGHAAFTTSALAPGSHPITAAYPGGTFFNSASSAVVNQVITGTVTNPVPTISNISPGNAAAGSGGFTLTVTGTNFVSSSSVIFNGAPRTTTFVSATQVTAAILASDVTTQGTPSVVVTNPTPGGGQSNTVTFTITAATNPVPTVTSLSPTGVAAGSGAFTLTVTGTNFVSGAFVNFGGANKTTTFVSSTQLTAAILAADVATAGTPAVIVTNPAPGGRRVKFVEF